MVHFTPWSIFWFLLHPKQNQTGQKNPAGLSPFDADVAQSKGGLDHGGAYSSGWTVTRCHSPLRSGSERDRNAFLLLPHVAVDGSLGAALNSDQQRWSECCWWPRRGGATRESSPTSSFFHGRCPPRPQNPRSMALSMRRRLLWSV